MPPLLCSATTPQTVTTSVAVELSGTWIWTRGEGQRGQPGISGGESRAGARSMAGLVVAKAASLQAVMALGLVGKDGNVILIGGRSATSTLPR